MTLLYMTQHFIFTQTDIMTLNDKMQCTVAWYETLKWYDDVIKIKTNTEHWTKGHDCECVNILASERAGFLCICVLAC